MHARLKKKSFQFSSFFHFSSQSPFCFVSFDSSLPRIPVFSPLSFLHLIHLSVSLLGQTASSEKFSPYSATGLSIYSHQSLHIWALSNIIPEPIKRPNWMRGWTWMDVVVFSCKLSVPGSILGPSLTDDSQHDVYSFSSWVSMLAATTISSINILFVSI